MRETLARLIVSGTPVSAAGLDDPELRACAREEGVLPLLEWAAGRWERELRAHAAVQLARRVRITRLLDALTAEGVPVLVIKGAQLAYTLYPDPALRPHVDTDLFIDPRDVPRARQLFERTGHHLIPHVSGDLVMSQFHFTDGSVGGAHTYDVHWRIANPAVFRRVLPFEEVYERAVSFDAYGTHSRGPSVPDALVIASVHRAAHHGATDRLIWMNDVRLLLKVATAAELEKFSALAERYRVSALAWDTCARAAALYSDAPVPEGLERLASTAAELSRVYLQAPSHLRQLGLDLRALPRWQDRIALLKEHAFPPASYLTQTSRSRAPLSWLYASRIIRGTWRRLIESVSPRPSPLQ